MAFPGSVDMITVHGGPFLTLDGNPASGTITFELVSAVRVVGDPTVIVASRYVATLDSTGEFSIELPATDDPDLEPVPFAYRVTENLTCPSGAPFYIVLPMSNPTVEYADLIPLPAPPPLPPIDYVTQAEFDLAMLGVVHIAGIETITGHKIFADTPTIVNAPVLGTDAANKAYVDSVVSGGNFSFVQAVPAATWVIAHGLATRPIVQILTAAGQEGGIPDVFYVDVNNLTVTFPAPSVGTAVMRR